MPEDTPAPPPTPPPSPDAPRRGRGWLSQAQLDALTKAKQIAIAAKNPAYTTQTAAQSDATTARAELDEMLKSITQRRMTLQFAADAEWPWHDPAHAGIRKEFYLPPGMPFTG